MNGVSLEKAPETKVEMSGAVEERLNLSTRDVFFEEKGNLSMERGNPWRSVALEKENP